MTQQLATADAATPQADAEALLRLHNPVLVLLPQDPDRKRPGAWWKGRTGRGDYHPCSAEFFLSLVAQSLEPRKWSWIPFKSGAPTAPTGIDELKRLVEEAEGDTESWELDIASFKSGHASKTWRRYCQMVRQRRKARQPVTYGRFRETDGRITLQYWYLYPYNDAANVHEGDWEMVCVELDRATRKPVRLGVSGHRGGAQRVWEGVTRRGERPVVYVARGSHAAYLDHMPLGHRTAEIDFPKGLPRLLDLPIDIAYRFVARFIFFAGVRDYTASIEDEGDANQGRLISPKLRIFPSDDDGLPPVDDPLWWWMNLHCRWGSSHARLRDFIAPPPPWRNELKWKRPIAWLDGLRER